MVGKAAGKVASTAASAAGKVASTAASTAGKAASAVAGTAASKAADAVAYPFDCLPYTLKGKSACEAQTSSITNNQCVWTSIKGHDVCYESSDETEETPQATDNKSIMASIKDALTPSRPWDCLKYTPKGQTGCEAHTSTITGNQCVYTTLMGNHVPICFESLPSTPTPLKSAGKAAGKVADTVASKATETVNYPFDCLAYTFKGQSACEAQTSTITNNRCMWISIKGHDVCFQSETQATDKKSTMDSIKDAVTPSRPWDCLKYTPKGQTGCEAHTSTITGNKCVYTTIMGDHVPLCFESLS
jgi:hypothetical protein